MLKSFVNTINQKKGMTLVEVMTAMTILTLMIFCFAPLFLSYFNSISIAGDKMKEVYDQSGFLQQVLNDTIETTETRFDSYYSEEFEFGIPIKSKTNASLTTTKPSEGQFIGSDSTNPQNGLVTYVGSKKNGRIMSFPSSITDDFKEKSIILYFDGDTFSDDFSNTATYKFTVNKKGESEPTVLEFGKDYVLERYGSKDNALVLTLRGGSNISFENSPLTINYRNIYEKQIEIDAPSAIMVGEQASNGNYYYYVTRGHIDESGSLEIIRREMTSSPLTSAMNDVEWVTIDDADSYAKNGNEKYGYYIMGGDNGQIRRFWRDTTGNYYWGGDYTYYTDVNFVADNVGSSAGKTLTVATDSKGNGSPQLGTEASYVLSIRRAAGSSGFKMVRRNKSELQSANVFTINARIDANKTSNKYTYSKREANNYYASDGKIYHVQRIKGDKLYQVDYGNTDEYLKYSTFKNQAHDTDFKIHHGGDAVDCDVTYNMKFDNLSTRSVYKYGNEAMTWLKAVDSMYTTTNPITITSVGAIRLNPDLSANQKAYYTNVTQGTYDITSESSTNVSYPTSTYNLYCGYIPAVMDVWSSNTDANTGFEDASVAHESGGTCYPITNANNNLDRNGGNLKSSDMHLYAKWKGTFGIEPFGNYEVNENGQLLYYVKASGWDYNRHYVYLYQYPNLGYKVTGRVYDATSPLGNGLENRAYSTMDGKQKNITNGEIVDITTSYFSHPLALHLALNPTDFESYDYSNYKDKETQTRQWSNRRETITVLDVASTLIPSGDQDISVSLAVGYTMGGIAELNDKEAYVNTIMNNGIVMLRAGDILIDTTNDSWTSFFDPDVKRATEEYFALDDTGWRLQKESNVFHQFYYLNSYNTEVKPEKGKHIGNLCGADGWMNNRHINYISLNGGTPDTPTANTSGNYNYLRCHPLANTKVTCVEWGTTWDDNPAAMWGTENGTMLSWEVDLEDARNNRNESLWNDKSVKAEFQSYRWILNVSGVNGDGNTLGEGKIFTNSTNSSAHVSTIGANGQKFAKNALAPEYLEFYDRWSRHYDNGKSLWKTAGFISVLDTINDVEFNDDTWVAVGDWSGQDPATFCNAGEEVGSATIKPYTGDGVEQGSWVNVRTWVDIKGTNKYVQYDANGAEIADTKNTQYQWQSVLITNKDNCNFQQVNYINGIWMATGYQDKNNNNVQDDGDEAIVCWTRNPSIPYGTEGGWSDATKFWAYTGVGEDGFTLLTNADVGGINSVAARS